MARRRKKLKSKTTRFGFATGRRKKKITIKDKSNLRVVRTLKALAIVSVLAAIGVGFYFVERHVKAVAGIEQKTGSLELVNVPGWVTDELKQKIRLAAGTEAEDFRLDDKAARRIAENLTGRSAWLDNVKVQITHDKILVQADYRKPIALVKSGLQKFYVDGQLVVLDYLPMPDLAIVRVKGISMTNIPPPGRVFARADLAVAVDVLKLLRGMDEQMKPNKPLLNEMESIDVSNFSGRERPQAAHIVLYAKDKTQIIWGAEVGMWHRHLEAEDEDKLAMLYKFYEENGTLLGNVKYIELRQPHKVPEPIDRY